MWRATGTVRFSSRGATLGLLIAIALLHLVGCGDAPPATDTNGGPDADAAASVGAETDPAALAARVDDLRGDLVTPGVVVAIRTPQLDWRYASGCRDRDGTQPIEVTDHLRIGSVTKTLTATVVLQLVDQGLIALDDPVALHLPALAEQSDVLERVEVGQLLDMTSGIPDHIRTEGFDDQLLFAEPARVWQPEELVRIALAEPPLFSPGEGWAYSNANTVLAGMVAEQASGARLAQLIDEGIAQPLGLHATSLPGISDASLPTPHAEGHLFVVAADPPVDGLELSAADVQRARAGELAPRQVTDHNPSWAWAAGAAISTVDDLSVFTEALVQGELLSDELHAVRLASLAPTAPEQPDAELYGYGLGQAGGLLGHNGTVPGFQAEIGHDPDHEITIVVLANLMTSPDGRDPAGTILRALHAQLLTTPS